MCDELKIVIVMVVIMFLMSGCAAGPVEVKHKHGSMPKLMLFDDCKVKLKGKVLTVSTWGIRNVTCTYEWN